ncbi:MAG: glycoside hydrolase family 30 beta sandwich domain-containing protein [Bacteroidota bacterium]
MIRNNLLSLILVFTLMAAGCCPSPTGPSEIPGVATIDLNVPQQLIRGFGGVNMPGWIPDLTSDQVQKAFGTGTGQIGLTILRIRVSYDSMEFNLEVPTALLAKSLGAIIFASPWTPPASMKTNNNIAGGALDTNYYAAYAAHLKSFADYMSNNGVPLYAVSVQNEPDYSATYETCVWTPSQLLKFVKNNVQTIGTRIIVPEVGNFDHAFSDPILNDPVAAANVSIIGGHIYGGGLTSYPLAISKGKEVWMTEHCDTARTWTAVLGTAKEINDCMNADMNAYVWWYIRRFYGLIDDNSNVTKRGYVMSQYAKFVRPGFYRVSATASPQTNVDVTAYKKGSKVVIVALNRNSSSTDQTFTIWNGPPYMTFTPYITSSTKNCAQGSDIAVPNGSFTVTLDSSSVTTFVLN